MATLQELRGLFTDSDLHEKVEAALIISVQTILEGTSPLPTDDQKRYAAHVFSSPKAEADKALMSVLGTNASATPIQITGAADTAIQANVDAVIDTLTAAYIAGLV